MATFEASCCVVVAAGVFIASGRVRGARNEAMSRRGGGGGDDDDDAYECRARDLKIGTVRRARTGGRILEPRRAS